MGKRFDGLKVLLRTEAEVERDSIRARGWKALAAGVGMMNSEGLEALAEEMDRLSDIERGGGLGDRSAEERANSYTAIAASARAAKLKRKGGEA